MRERLHRVGHWLANPETGKAIAGSLLAAAIIAFVITSGINQHESNVTARAALKTRDDTARRAARRVDMLNLTLSTQGAQLVRQGERIGELAASVVALQEDARRHGQKPIVTQRPREATTTTTTRPPSTTTTTTTTQQPGRRCIAGICLKGPKEKR